MKNVANPAYVTLLVTIFSFKAPTGDLNDLFLHNFLIKYASKYTVRI